MHSRGAPRNCERLHSEICQENKDKHFRTPHLPPPCTFRTAAPWERKKKKLFPLLNIWAWRWSAWAAVSSRCNAYNFLIALEYTVLCFFVFVFYLTSAINYKKKVPCYSKAHNAPVLQRCSVSYNARQVLHLKCASARNSVSRSSPMVIWKK